MATKTTTSGKGGDICNRELLPGAGHRALRSQELIAAAELSTLGLADVDEDDEVPSLEAVIQAVLNSNTEETDSVESLECLLS